MNKKHNGFTLLELMIAVTLLGVMVALAAPSYSDFVQRQAVRSDAQVALKAITNARMAAMVIEEAATTVCWNTGGSDKDVTDSAAKSHTINANAIAVIEGSATANFGEIVSSGALGAGNVVVFEKENEVDDCIGFDAQGRLIEFSHSGPFGMVFCRATDDATDARRIEVSTSGRIANKLNDDTGGVGVMDCS